MEQSGAGVGLDSISVCEAGHVDKSASRIGNQYMLLLQVMLRTELAEGQASASIVFSKTVTMTDMSTLIPCFFRILHHGGISSQSYS